jgi:hypothetical protein
VLIFEKIGVFEIAAAHGQPCHSDNFQNPLKMILKFILGLQCSGSEFQAL